MAARADGDSSPNLKILLIEAQSVTTEWPEIGIFLGLEHSDIEIIENDFDGKISRCKMEMFSKWLKLDVNPTWEKFCDALANSSHKALASQIRRKYVEQHVSCGKLDDQCPPDDVTIDISRKDVFAKEFYQIEREFVYLLEDTEDSFEGLLKSGKRRKFSLSKLTRFCRIHYSEFPSDNFMKLEELFKEIRKYVCFLNYSFLEAIIERYLDTKAPIAKRLRQYDQHLEEFKNSVTVEQFKDRILRAHNPSEILSDRPPEGFCKVTIYLRDGWLELTMKNLEKLVAEIFKHRKSVLTHLRILRGSVVVIYWAPQSEVTSIIALAKQEIHFMSRVGVYQLQIGEVAINIHIDDGYNYEEGLIEAAENNDVRILGTLLELRTSSDVIDKQGWSVLNDS